MSVKNATLSTFSPVTYVRMVAVVSLVVSLCSGVGYWQSGKKRKQKDQELQELEKRKDVEIKGLRHNLTETRAHLQANEDAMMALKGQIDRLRGSVIEAHRQSQDLHIEAEKLKEQVRAREEQGQAWKRELDTTKDKYKQTQDLLNTRSSELKAAQTFLMTTDKLSNVDVIKLVEALNAEILQTSALVADAFQFEAKAENGYEVSEELNEVLERATEIVGRRMVRLLTSAEHKEDPILVQIAIQAGLCAYAHWIISSWYFQGIENEQILREIYQQIRNSEEQAIYGRWRALTRKHIHRMIDGNQDLAMFFLDAFVNILITAGVKDGRERICEEIESRFSSEIENIVKKSQELNKAIGEEVTSCELEILYMEPDHVFDESIMEDTFQDQTKDTTQEPEGVLCTTDLGLIRHEKTTGGDGWQNTILIKPKIVLQSKLDAIIASDDEN